MVRQFPFIFSINGKEELIQYGRFENEKSQKRSQDNFRPGPAMMKVADEKQESRESDEAIQEEGKQESNAPGSGINGILDPQYKPEYSWILTFTAGDR